MAVEVKEAPLGQPKIDNNPKSLNGVLKDLGGISKDMKNLGKGLSDLIKEVCARKAAS